MSTRRSSDGDWSWAVLVAAFLINFFMDGLANSIGVMGTELVVQLELPRQLNGWITSVRVAVTLGAGPVASLCSRRFGNRPTVFAGALICSVGYGASSFVTEPWTLLITYGLGVGFGMALIYLPTLVVLGLYFDKLRSSATGIAVCGSGLGTLALSPLISHLIDTYSWRGCFQILSAVILHCAAMATVFRPTPAVTDPSDLQEALEAIPLDVKNLEKPEPTTGQRLARLLQLMPRLALFLAANLLASVGYNPPFLFSPDRAQQFAGASRESASLLVSILGAANTAGRAVFGLLADRTEGARRLMLYGVAVGAAGTAQALAFVSVSYAYMAVWCAFTGFLICPYVSMMPSLLVDLAGLDNLSEGLALTLVFQAAGGLIGSPLAGYLYDTTRSFDLPFGICGAAVATGGLLVCLQINCRRDWSSQARCPAAGFESGRRVLTAVDTADHLSSVH